MTKLTLGSHPHMLGFKQLERLLERTAKTGNEGYPHLISNKHRIVDIELRWLLQGLQKRTRFTVEDRQLVIRGRQRDDSSECVICTVIAARQFQRSFVLAEGVDVGDATMENGLLHIDLTQVMPETVVQTIKIKRGRGMENTVNEILTDERIVYVRPVSTSVLPDDVREELGNIDEAIGTISAAGERLALVTERDMAFVLARQNDLSPVAVH